MLALLEFEDIAAQVTEKDGICVYGFIPPHVQRAIGSMRIVTTWGRTAPCYQQNENEEMVFQGSFAQARPWRNWFYDMLTHESLFTFFHFDWPLIPAYSQYRRTAQIVSAAAQQYQKRFGNDAFYVLLYPTLGTDFRQYGMARRAFEECGLKVLDYSENLALDDPSNYYPNDYHPMPCVNVAIAERLAADLGLAHKE
jgi:hypothetical protein